MIVGVVNPARAHSDDHMRNVPGLGQSVRAGAWTAAVLVLVACGGSRSLDVQERGDVTALVATDSEQASDAEVRGVVELGPGGCLGLVSEEVVVPIPLIWPEGSELAEDGGSVTVPGVGEVRVGASISGGGGEDSNVEAERYRDVPEGCLDPGRLIVAATVRSVTG